MSQQRNTVEVLTAHNAIDDDAILDAAYPLLLAVGPRRLTMADVARHTDVSRATLYRRWPNVRALVGALVTREWAQLSSLVLDSRALTGRARLVDGVVKIVRASREHPLLRLIVEFDPEFLLPYLLERRGTSTDAQLAVLESGIRAGQADGSIRRGRPATLAQAVQLTATSFVLSAPAIATDVKVLDKELATLLDRYLAS